MHVTFQTDEGILAIEPDNKLEDEHFQTLGTTLERVLKSDKDFNGLLIHTKKMKDYERFTDFLAYGEFVAQYDDKLPKIAIATDSKLGALFEVIGENIVKGDVQTFAYKKRDEAEQWLAN